MRGEPREAGIDGRSALVTGAVSGIGLAIARRPASEGKRMIEPEEVADAIAYLCRPGAWTMTGGVLTLDAGWLAH